MKTSHFPWKKMVTKRLSSGRVGIAQDASVTSSTSCSNSSPAAAVLWNAGDMKSRHEWTASETRGKTVRTCLRVEDLMPLCFEFIINLALVVHLPLDHLCLVTLPSLLRIGDPPT